MRDSPTTRAVSHDRASPPPHFDDLEVGAAIPPYAVPPVTRLQLALFAAAAADPNPIHVDDDAARASGLSGAIVHGMLTMAFLGEMLTRWVAPSDLRSLEARFVAMAFPGDAITCSGTVVGKRTQDGERLVDFDLAAQNQNDVKLLTGKATVAFP